MTSPASPSRLAASAAATSRQHGPDERDRAEPRRPLRPQEHQHAIEDRGNTLEFRLRQIQAARCIQFLCDLSDDDPIWRLLVEWGPVRSNLDCIYPANFSYEIALFNLQDQRKILAEWESAMLKNYYECAGRMEHLLGLVRYLEREMDHEEQLEELIKSFRENSAVTSSGSLDRHPSSASVSSLSTHPKTHSVWRGVEFPSVARSRGEVLATDDEVHQFFAPGQATKTTAGRSPSSTSEEKSSQQDKAAPVQRVVVVGEDGKPLCRVDPMTGTASGGEPCEDVRTIHEELMTRYRLTTYSAMAHLKILKCIEIFSEIVEYNIRRLHRWRGARARPDDSQILQVSLKDIEAFKAKKIQRLRDRCSRIPDPKSVLDRLGSSVLAKKSATDGQEPPVAKAAKSLITRPS